MHGSSVLRIVIAYENYATGVHAMSMSQRLAGQFESEVEVDRELWSFKALSDPELLHRASTAASSADMLIVAGTKIPPLVQQWIQGWAERRVDAPAAVVLLPGAETPGDLASLRQLRDKLRKTDVEVFCREVSDARACSPWGLEPDARDNQEPQPLKAIGLSPPR